MLVLRALICTQNVAGFLAYSVDEGALLSRANDGSLSLTNSIRSVTVRSLSCGTFRCRRIAVRVGFFVLPRRCKASATSTL